MLYVVDDEMSVKGALQWVAGMRNIDCIVCSSGIELLGHLNIPLHEEDGQAGNERPSQVRFDPRGDCIILDIRMPGGSGLEIFDLLIKKKLGRRLPVIFITGHGDLGCAVDVIKRGAFDFFEKPFDDSALIRKATLAIEMSRKEAEHAKLQQRFTSLTTREREILGLILVGKMNKVIADLLGISMRTVEVHRANILDKMAVKTAMELAAVLR